MSDKNMLRLAGRVIDEPNLVEIVTKTTGEKIAFVEFKISIKRLSDQCDILPVTVQQNLNKPIKKDDFIRVDGELHSVDKKIDGKKHLKLFVCGKEYTIIKTTELYDNFITLKGFIAQPPCHRFTPFGKEITDIFLANHDNNGNSYYLPCIVWGSNSRFAKDLPVGSKISIVGRLQSREYVKKINDEEKICTTYEVSGNEIALLKSPKNKNIKTDPNKSNN